MDELVEIIPDDLPDWAIKAMAEGQFFNVVNEKMKELQELKFNFKALLSSIKIQSKYICSNCGEWELGEYCLCTRCAYDDESN